jgi:hypothetical protein
MLLHWAWRRLLREGWDDLAEQAGALWAELEQREWNRRKR